MKINFDLTNTQNQKADLQQNAGKVSTGKKSSEKKTNGIVSGHTVIADAGQYGFVKESANIQNADALGSSEIAALASGLDTSVQQKYMTVMSNSMSEEDYQKMMEDGYDPSEIDPEQASTILDQIKLDVAAGGTTIDGFNDQEVLKKLLPVTESLDNASIHYMIENKLQPTIENIYKASYAASDTSYKMTEMSENAFDQLRPQMEKVIKDAGLEVTSENLTDAKALIENELPLIPETLIQYKSLKELKITTENPKIQQCIAAAVNSGKDAEEADLTKTMDLYQQAIATKQKVDTLIEAAVDLTVSENRPLNLVNLQHSQEKIEQGKVEPGNTVEVQPLSEKLLTARRTLEEIRLQMTVEANLKLLQSDYQIDTAPIEKLLHELKNAESQLQSSPVKAANEIAKQVEDIKFMPVDVIGQITSRAIPFTILDVYEKGTTLLKEYQAAEKAYEPLSTAPRADLGDSIRKAFQSVDTLLENLGIDTTPENERAVRILGYNSMEVTKTNLEDVLKADQTLQNIFEKLTPAKTLRMIREGVNPLTMDLPKMSEYLDELQIQEKEQSYSKFLYQLDQNKSITQEERSAYIGVYRLLRQAEKSDGAAVGYLINSGAEINMQNLLTAVRSGKKTGIDYKVDESFAGAESTFKTENIITQIQTAFQEMEQQLSDENTEKEYVKQQFTEFKAAMHVSDEALQMLNDYGQNVTGSQLAAADLLLHQSGKLFQQLDAALHKKSKRVEGSKESDVIENFTDAESAQEGYQEYTDQILEQLQEVIDDTDVSYVDLKAIQSMQKQISLAASLCREENYYVPLETSEGLTAINLKIVHGKGVQSATISIELAERGTIGALFQENQDSLSLMMLAETTQGYQFLQNQKDRLGENLSINRFNISTMTIVQVDNVSASLTVDQAASEPSEKITLENLYQVSKIFMETIRNE